MVTSSVARVVLRDEGDIERLLGQLPPRDAGTLVLEVPLDSGVLRTAGELRRLRVALDATGATWCLHPSTDDRVRRTMARLLGVPLLEDAPDGRKGSRVLTERPGTAGDGETTADIASYVSPNRQLPQETRAWRSPTGTVVIATDAGMPGRPSETAQGARLDPRPMGDGRRGRARGRTRANPTVLTRVALVTAVLAIAATVATVLVLLLVPHATVTLVPETRALAVELTYGVDAGAAGVDLAIVSRQIERTVTVELSALTSGERFEPDGTAVGQVVLVNPFPRSVAVPSGTPLTGSNGMTYYTSEDITIAAADPFGSLSFGSAVVGVWAATPGPDGNADPGVLAGQLDNGVFYNNQQPISGGTLKRVPLVSEDDLQQLRQRALTALQERVEQAVRDALVPGEQVIEDSLDVSDPALEFSHQAGDVAETVSVRASVVVRARAYDPEAVHELARQEAGRRLARLAGPELVVLGNTLVVSTPEPVGTNGMMWTIRASGQARAVISDDQVTAARDAVLGRSVGDAVDALREMEGVADARVALEPDWVPRRMPEFASRVDVVVARE